MENTIINQLIILQEGKSLLILLFFNFKNIFPIRNYRNMVYTEIYISRTLLIWQEWLKYFYRTRKNTNKS